MPEIFTEGKIDFEKFQQLFADEISTESDRYQLNWAGKSAAYQTLKIPSNKTLTPCKTESVNFDKTQNIFIEGENLDVLKVLQKSYFNSVKMIYIDPPYNTGNDFVYHDNFAQSQTEYLTQTGEKGEDGLLKKAFRKNSKENGHYHSNWLNMMLPRLHLSRNLLKDDGVIFISIDDNEQAQLKLLCDEVFGEENFVGSLPTIMNLKGNNDEFGFSGTHEYTIVYMKDKTSLEDLNGIPLTEDDYADYDKEDEKGKFYQGATLMRTGIDGSRERRPNGYYPIFVSHDYSRMSVEKQSETDFIVYPITKDGKEMSWRRSKDTLEKSLTEFMIKHTKQGKISFYKKQRLEDDLISGKKSKSLLYKPAYSSGNGTQIIKQLFDKKVFQNPKPLELLKDFIRIGSNYNDLVCDFFSGSGSFPHAVMQLNAEDGGNRRFICVQLPELTDEKSEAYKAGFKNIAEISKERIRRAGSQIMQKNSENAPLVDVGFKVFKLTESHFKQWQSPTKENMGSLVEQLEMYIDNVKENSDLQAVFYEILLRLGLKLTAEVHLENSVFWVNEDERLYAILLESVNEAILANVIAKQPQKVVALDRLFSGNDALKKNSELQMKDAGIAFFVI